MTKKRFLTSLTNFHIHTWNPKDKRTSINDGHSHPINLKKKLAEKGRTDHTHRLLRRLFIIKRKISSSFGLY